MSQAVQQGRLPKSIQPWRPTTPDEWRAHVTAVKSGSGTGWYRAIAPAFSASGEAKRRLERVANEGGVVVTTGQQAVLFGGPLYTLAKALTALELADDIERQLGVPTAPVFWAATDDADFLEASVTYAADARGLHELRTTEKPDPGTPMSRAPIGDLTALLGQLRSACGSAANPTYFDAAHDAFGEANRTMGDAYVRLLRSLLEPLGVGVMDSSHPAYREAARPVLVDALHRAQDIARVDAECAEEIRRTGFEPQVLDDRGLSLVVVFDKDGTAKRRVTVEEAERLAARMGKKAPFAPNVLLRPVIERAILPTVAYVGGPAELAYFAQSNAVAKVLGREPVVGVPRWSATVIEPFAQRALDRLGVPYHEVRDVPALERRLAQAALPPKVGAAWKTLQEQVKGAVAELARAVSDTQLMPAPVVEGLDRSLAHRLQRMERRLLAAVKRRDERIRDDLRVAAAALFPLGERQERVLNFIPMLTRGGPELIDDLRAAARAHAATLMRVQRGETVTAR